MTISVLRPADVNTARTDAALRARSERVERLNAALQERMARKQSTWGGDLTVLGDAEMAELPLVLRRAHAFRKALEEMPIAIEHDDLVVGNTLQNGAVVRTSIPSFALPAELDEAGESGAVIATHLAHKTPFYPLLMEKGLGGVIADIDTRMAEIAGRPASSESGDREEKLALFGAMRVEARAVIGLAHRYADLAERLAAGTPDTEHRAELRTIAAVCRRVPEHPAQSFHEAVQSFWFVHYAFFSTGTAMSCGRIDQYLYPAFRSDFESGELTLTQAQELIDSMWLRFNDRAQIDRDNFFEGDAVRDWAAGHRTRFAFASDAADAINHFGQNILLSGIRPDGEDGTNELTYLCLNSLEKLAYTSPVVTVRLHRNSPPELVERSAEVLKSGGGMPYLNNDDAIVGAYIDLGVTPEDARDYANSNCWETMLQGRSDQELIRGMNFLLCVELAMNRGQSSVHGSMGPDTGDPRQYPGFDDLMAAWKAQIDHQLCAGIDYIGKGVGDGTLEHSNHGKYNYNPLLSALTLDCIEKEQDVIRGGARYTVWHVMGEAVANAIDAMSAVKKFVFDERSVTMDELLTALEAGWKGHENLRRQFATGAPGFANDDDYADEIGREMMTYFVERTRHHANRYPKVIFPPSVGTFSWYVMIGHEVGATPDGRRPGEPIAANFSPAPGSDLNGPTAAINSYLKMPVKALAAGAPIDLRFSASGLSGQAGTNRLAGLVKAFVDLGGNMLTMTVTDAGELKRAMEEPDRYRHLRVRMGGWSAYFVMLSREQQLLHISRVEHGMN